MSAPMYEGYGQTENTAACFMRCLADKSTGNVGGIVVIINLSSAKFVVQTCRHSINEVHIQ